MSRSEKVIDLRPKASKGPPQGQVPLFSVRSWREPESPKRPTPLRVKRRKMRVVALFLVLLMVAGAVWGISWASHLPQFSINLISITGAEQVPQRLIRSYVETILNDGSHRMFSRSNIFLYPRSVIEEAVESFFPRIKSATISRKSLLATAIIVTVEERKPYATWCSEVRCYVMDDGGFIFSEVFGAAPLNLTAPYIFRGGIASSTSSIGQRFAPAHLPGILVLLELLRQAGFNPLGGSIENDRDLVIPFAESFALKVSFGQDAHTLTKNLQLVLSSEPLKGKENQLEYIDLRFDNRVYYKLRGRIEAASSTQ